VDQYYVEPGGVVSGRLRVPGDKSISHRAVMLGAVAVGTTKISGFLEGEDTLMTLQAFRNMGVVIQGPEKGVVLLEGVGLHGLKKPSVPLYLGNSGTAMRLLAGLLSGQDFDVQLTGDISLSKRPMKRIADPLTAMGVAIETSADGRPPLLLKGNTRPRTIDYHMPMASAQVKSCILLAGLYAQGETSVTEPAPTRDHTERMLRGFGYVVYTKNDRISLTGGGELKGISIDIPADISSAAFFMVAAAITPGSDIVLEHVGINPTRLGVITILKQMGADISLDNQRSVSSEPVADIRVRYSPLRGIDISESDVPLAIDELPVLFIAAACAEGVTVLTGAEELRFKESDRIQVMAGGLQTLGVSAEPRADGIIIKGGQLQGGQVNSCGDHRIAMAFAVAGLMAVGPVIIDDCTNVSTSFPGFVRLARQAGIRIKEQSV
jgi:3-phosphoshikimate 1-carboxyvinyltransferase